MIVIDLIALLNSTGALISSIGNFTWLLVDLM